MSSKRTPIIAGVGILVLLAVLFAWPKMTNPDRKTIARWNAGGLDCLAGHTTTSQHFHPVLRILVDGVEEVIPANEGLVPSCMSEVHTHDLSGTIHVESADGFQKFYLKDFFLVFSKPFQREGYNLTMKVDDKLNMEFESLMLRDKQKITLEYIKK